MMSLSNKDIQKSDITFILSYNKRTFNKLKMKKNSNHRVTRSVRSTIKRNALELCLQ